MLGENLKHYRERAGYSQPDLSKKTGVSHSTISRIEHGKIDSPSYDILAKLARALNVTLGELTGQQLKPQPGDHPAFVRYRDSAQ